MTIDWQGEVERRRTDIIRTTQSFLRIRSVLNEAQSKEGMPFGPGIQDAMEFLLQRCQTAGFRVKRLEGYAAHAEYGSGDDLLGILCHVDVVPEGDGWTTPPYEASIRDNRIYARGAIDDKGPTMAAFFALSIVKELALPLNRRVRLIIGGDEESNWRCMKRYFATEEMPTIGFAPDAEFPLIFAEKGIWDVKIGLDSSDTSIPADGYRLYRFHAGMRRNMVPERATAAIQSPSESALQRLQERFSDYCGKRGIEGKIQREDGLLHMEMAGKSAHGMEPHKGANAGLLLADFLKAIPFDRQGSAYLAFLADALGPDTTGANLGIACRDETSGSLTVNAGVMRYELNERERTVWLNIRYPVSFTQAELEEQLSARLHRFQAHVEESHDNPPHHVDQGDFLVQTLLRVYREVTGDMTAPLSIGGGTYARSLQSGVAFGPLFPGRPQVAHQKDEYIEIEDLLKATAIYAQAIHELCR